MASKQIKGKPQTFSVAAPAATRVLLAGDFTNWEQQPLALKKDGAGVWRTSVQLPPGMHEYRFIVDGQWCDDPDCAVRAPNPYGTENAVIQVG
jgi:1,4-alpha-glucan branching enzyme